MKKLPNILTIMRVLLVPLVVAIFVIFHDGQNDKLAFFLAFIIFILGGITDFFDGYFARKYNVESKLGAMLDPIADKLMIVTMLVILVAVGRADLIPVLVIIMRELLVSGYRDFLSAHNGEMPVTKLAKWKTTAQFVAITMLLFVPLAAAEHFNEVDSAARILLWFAGLLTFITGWQYTTHTIRFIKGLEK